MSISPVNTYPVNSEAVNSNGTPLVPVPVDASVFGLFNTTPLNCIEVDAGFAINALIEDDVLIGDVRQKVGIGIDSQDICTISQDVILYVNIPSTNICSIAQSVKAYVSSENICSISQNVINTAANNFLSRHGYTVQIVVDSQVLPDSMIAGNIVITKEESQANQATLSLLVQNPVDFIDAIWGKTITIDYVTSTSSKRQFTGVVAIPEIDLLNRRVNITCSNNRDELINNKLAGSLKTTGRYSYEVQGSVTDTASEMKHRISTVQKSLDFDGYNVPRFNSWYAKSVPDYTLTASSIYYRQPKVIWQDRTKIRNYESINIQYQYTRLYHYQQEFSWTFPFDFCTFLQSQYSMPSVQMIEDAISGAGWRTVGNTIYTSVFPPGSCAFGAQLILWNTSSLANQGTYSTVFDSEGNVISDPDGNNVYGFSPFTEQTDLSQIYTIGAQWVASTRFSQYIIENYSITVKSTQSITQFGEVKDVSKTSIKDDFDAGSWEDYTEATAQPADAVTFAGGSYYFNQDTDPALMTNAILTSIDLAKTSIYGSHRNTFVIAETPIMPDLELSHTVKMDSDLITAKGKVQKIVHTIELYEGVGSSTEITLALFRSKGTATETPTKAPARPTDAIDLNPGLVTLGNNYGVTDESFNGFIGNKLNPLVAGTPPRTSVQEEFRVDTPKIPDAYRKSRTLTSGPTTYELNIPNDLLEVEFEE